MTVDQALAFGLIGATVLCFLWGRLPYDLVAMAALVVGVAIGIIPASHAFEGFSDEVVIIIAAALVVSAAIARSGVVEAAMRPITPHLRTTKVQVPALVGFTLVLSMATKNVGALAIFMPVALQLARRNKTPASALLMPMAFASMIGGLVTLVGTSPNILVSKVRADATGKPFGMFDFTPVGLSIAVIGFVFLTVGWRLLPHGRRGASAMDAAFNMEDYTAEARVLPGSPTAGRTVAELEVMGEGEVQVGLIIRERFRRLLPTPGWTLRDDDLLLLRGEPEALERVVNRARLSLAGGGSGAASVVEGVVTADSPLVGQTLSHARLEERFAMGVLAVSRSGQQIAQRLGTVRLRAGDVIVIRSASPKLPDILGELHILPLAERTITLGRSNRSLVPALVLVVAMGMVALHLAPVAVAFFGAAVVLLLMRVMTMHEAYATVEWHVLILLGPLIPISHAVRDTGGTALIAGWMTHAVAGFPRHRSARGGAGVDHGGHPVPAQRADRADHGADRVQPGEAVGTELRRVLDGGSGGRGLRLPHPDRAPVQHAGDGAGRIPVRRLCPTGCAVILGCDPGRGAADRVFLALGRALNGGLATRRALVCSDPCRR